MGKTRSNGAWLESLDSSAPVRISILVAPPMSLGSEGRYVSSAVEVVSKPAAVPVHVIVNASVLGSKASRENSSACFDAFKGTRPEVRMVPSTDTVTIKEEVSGSDISEAPVILSNVMGVSTRIAMGVGSPRTLPASSGRYGLMAGPQRRARGGLVDASGIANCPPT